MTDNTAPGEPPRLQVRLPELHTLELARSRMQLAHEEVRAAVRRAVDPLLPELEAAAAQLHEAEQACALAYVARARAAHSN